MTTHKEAVALVTMHAAKAKGCEFEVFRWFGWYFVVSAPSDLLLPKIFSGIPRFKTRHEAETWAVKHGLMP